MLRSFVLFLKPLPVATSYCITLLLCKESLSWCILFLLLIWMKTKIITLRLSVQLIVIDPLRWTRGSYQAGIMASVFSELPEQNEKWTDRGSTSAKCHQEAAHTHMVDLVRRDWSHWEPTTHTLTCLARWSRPPRQTFALIRWGTLPSVLTVTVAHHCVIENKTHTIPPVTTRGVRVYV